MLTDRSKGGGTQQAARTKKDDLVTQKKQFMEPGSINDSIYNDYKETSTKDVCNMLRNMNCKLTK